MMNREIKWTPESIITFNENLDYLAKKWDVNTLNKFINRVDEIIASIIKNPYLFQSYNTTYGIHRCIINRNITLYYRIKDNNKIDLITFWNSHKNPMELNL